MILGKKKLLPSNRPEKLSVARQRFFFLFLFLASGMSIGWLEGMSVKTGGPLSSCTSRMFLLKKRYILIKTKPIALTELTLNVTVKHLKYSPCLGEESKLNEESIRWDPFLVKSSDSKGF